MSDSQKDLATQIAELEEAGARELEAFEEKSAATRDALVAHHDEVEAGRAKLQQRFGPKLEALRHQQRLAEARERWDNAQAAYTPAANANALALEAWQNLPATVLETLVAALDAHDALRGVHDDLRAAWWALDAVEPGSAGREPQLPPSPIPVRNLEQPGAGLLHEVVRNDKALTGRLNGLNRGTGDQSPQFAWVGGREVRIG